MARHLKYDIPGPDRRVAFEDLRDAGVLAAFAPDLPAPRGLVVELGFGRGEFLWDLAAAAPDRAFLGVEYSGKRVLKMARRLAKGGPANVRILQARAEDAVADLLGPGSVDTFWVNFSDPWPKARHHRRRMIQPAFARALAERLVPGGALEVATDDVPYAEWIDAALAGEPLLENALAPEPFAREVPGRKATAYELEWRAEGRPLHFFRYRRRNP
jgi:tRNA (guanine-N7-)-methyltransferase